MSKFIQSACLVFLLTTSVALADCKSSGARFSQAEKDLGPVVEGYENVSKEMLVSTNKGALIDRTILMNRTMLEAYDKIIDALQQLKDEGCMIGKYAQDYINVLEQLRIKRQQFRGEEEILQNNIDTIKNLTTSGKSETAQQKIVAALDKTIKSMNERAPFATDSKTQITKVERYSRQINYYLRLNINIDAFPKQKLAAALQDSLNKKICDGESSAVLIGIGFEITNFYRDANDVFVGTANVSKRTCDT